MADAPSLVNNIFDLVDDLVKKVKVSQRSNSALASSELRESRRKAEVVLKTSQQKFQVWAKTWLENASDPEGIAEMLWGRDGWTDIQKLLSSVSDKAREIDFELAKKDESLSHMRWRTLRASLTKKNRSLVVKRPLIDLAVQLSRAIDELWTYSEVAFDSLHGLFSHRIGPPRRETLLVSSLHARTGSLALYEACNQSKADYSLNVDLLGEDFEIRSTFRRRSSVSSTTAPRLFYHLFAQEREASNKINVITMESISRPGEQDFSNTEVVEFDIKNSDLAIYQTWPPRKSKIGLFSIHPHAFYAPSYFRTPKPPSVLSLDDLSSANEKYMESLAQLLYKDRIGSTPDERPLTQESRVHLAFKVVECGFYLLGTPWLAFLSSKRLRRLKDSEKSPFVLEVQTLNLEELYIEDPDALCERSQLFSIGVILVEIALSDERNPHNIRDPDLRKSKVLPLVERSMGSLYSGATAFCLADRRSAPQFGRPEKYKYPEETGWTSYLAELLEDYHAQVFSRSVL